VAERKRLTNKVTRSRGKRGRNLAIGRNMKKKVTPPQEGTLSRIPTNYEEITAQSGTRRRERSLRGKKKKKRQIGGWVRSLKTCDCKLSPNNKSLEVQRRDTGKKG